VISAFAETNRVPFDLPEAEGELVAGYHTEYSSMKFAMFFTAEYANMVTTSCLATLLFLGGWLRPLPWEGLAYTPVVVFGGFALVLLKFSFNRRRLLERIFLPIVATVFAGLAFLFFWETYHLPAGGVFWAEGIFWFLAKVAFFIFLYIWVRWTLPRFRYDTLMEFGWKRLVPISIANLLITGFVIAWRAR
jgi:NADH-quinone oxidoreductase subunit H